MTRAACSTSTSNASTTSDRPHCIPQRQRRGDLIRTSGNIPPQRKPPHPIKSALELSMRDPPVAPILLSRAPRTRVGTTPSAGPVVAFPECPDRASGRKSPVTSCVSCGPARRGPCPSTDRDRTDRQLHAVVRHRYSFFIIRALIAVCEPYLPLTSTVHSSWIRNSGSKSCRNSSSDEK